MDVSSKRSYRPDIVYMVLCMSSYLFRGSVSKIYRAVWTLKKIMWETRVLCHLRELRANVNSQVHRENE